MSRLLTYNNSGDTAPSPSGTVTNDTTNKFEGADSRSYAASSYDEWTVLSMLERVYFPRFYLRIEGTPSATIRVFNAVTTGGGSGLTARLTTGKALRLFDQAGGFIGEAPAALSEGAWHLIEIKMLQKAAGNGTAAMKIDGTQVIPDTTADLLNVAVNRWRYGRPSSTGTITALNIDTIALNDDQGGSENSYPGPFAVSTQPRPGSLSLLGVGR